VHDREPTTKARQETRKTRALDPAAQEQNRLLPARIKAAWLHHQFQAATKSGQVKTTIECLLSLKIDVESKFSGGPRWGNRTQHELKSRNHEDL
jgi:hypothetical protein